MYKIEIRYTKTQSLCKKKLYEDKAQFEKWKKKHNDGYVKRFKDLCYLECYKLNSKGIWFKI